MIYCFITKYKYTADSKLLVHGAKIEVRNILRTLTRDPTPARPLVPGQNCLNLQRL